MSVDFLGANFFEAVEEERRRENLDSEEIFEGISFKGVKKCD